MAATEQQATLVPTEAVSHRPPKRPRFLAFCLGVCLLQGQTSKPEASQKLFDSISAQMDRGEHKLALEPARQAWLQAQPGSEWQLRFRLLYAQALLWNSKSTDADAILKEAPPAQYAAHLPRYQYLRAYVLFSSGDRPAAERLARASVSGAHALHDALTETDSLLLLASQLKNTMLARNAALSALTLSTQNHLPVNEAAALLDLGFQRMNEKRFADAIPYFQQAAPLAGSLHSHYLHVLSLSNLGECYYQVGDLDRSERTLGDARRLMLGSEPDSLKWYVSYESGYLYLLREKMPEALASFRQALALTARGERYIMAATEMAEALLKEGSIDEAERYNGKAQAMLASSRDRNEDLQASMDLNGADIAAARGELQQAAQGYEKVVRSQAHAAVSSVQWSAFAKLGLVQQHLGQWSSAKASFGRALESIEASRSAQKNAEYQMYFLSDLITFYQQYVALLIARHEDSAALAVADSSRASLLTQGRVNSRELPSFQTRLQRLAGSTRSVILFYWLAEKSGCLWAITPGGTRIFPLPAEDQIKRDVAEYNVAVQSKRQDTLAESNAAGKRLYRTLLGNVTNLLPSGSRAIIIPDGILHNLNFETLLVEGPNPHYWINDVTVTVAPSLNILLNGGARASRATRTALLFGDALGSGPEFPRLPESAAEIASVRKYFQDAAVITQREAKVEAYGNSHPERFATIHISAHVDTDAQSPLDSAIILTPGEAGNRLYARDIAFYKSPLTAGLVTISGCFSTGAKPLSGEGLVGFAWASLYAGAHNAVTSLWEVDDRSTAVLMEKFYTLVAAGRPYSAALHEAKLAMMKSYRKPYYWAPFQLYSRGIKSESNPVNSQSR